MEKIIKFNTELTEELGEYVLDELLDVYNKNKEIIACNERLKYKEDYLPMYDRVTFLINSPGGSLYSFMQIKDWIEKIRNEQGVIFVSHTSSIAYSAGFYLMMCMDYRYMGEWSQVLYHELGIGNQMKLSDWNAETNRMNKIQTKLDKLVTDNCDLTQDILDSYKGKDLIMDYDEALEYGIVKEEPTEEEQLAKALEDMEKEEMTQSEFDAFVEEMKSYVNIIPDEPKPTEEEIQDKIKEIEGDTEPDMTLGEAVKEVLGEDFRCNGETKCDEFGDRCCYMCENFDKCDGLCEYAERAETCEYMESKLNELDKQDVKEKKECIETADCELHNGEFICCYLCKDYSKCDCEDKCIVAWDFKEGGKKEKNFICENLREKLEELDNECKCEIPCEDCTCKENKQEEIIEKYCDEPIDCEYHNGTFKCCMYCEEYENCAYINKCEYVIEFKNNGDSDEVFDCKYFKEPLDE